MESGSRRIVTAVFVDVVGSTSIAETMDPEAFARLMSRFYDEITLIVESHGGTVEKFIGDAIKASFGVPAAHEDDPLRAVRAAVAMRDAVEELNHELRSRWGLELEITIGINTGEVMSLTHTGQAVALGDPMNVAARLQQAASPGDILVGKSTFALVRDAVDAEPLDDLILKGKRVRETAYRIRSLDPSAAAIRRYLDRPIVGRDKELQILLDVADDPRSTPGCGLVNVIGEPGIGKSRLLGETMARLASTDTLVIQGSCLPYGESVAYAPIVNLIMSWVNATGDARSALSPMIRSTVAGEADGDLIADRILQIIGVEDSTAPPEELFWAVRKLLEVLGRARPVVVIVEDLHWADAPTLDLLEHLVDWARDASILLVCSFRPELLDDRPQWERKAKATLRLEPLSEAASRALVEEISAALGSDVDRQRDVVAVGGGNPLFIEQLVAALEEMELDPDRTRGVGVPASIQALLTSRLDALPPPERGVIQAAAVVGAEFSIRAVQGLLTEDASVQLPKTIQSLMAKNLVRPERWEIPTGQVFSFHHALIREAAYRALPHERRASLHRQVGEWLVADDPPAPSEVVAHHYEEAFRSLKRIGILDQASRDLALEAAELLENAGRAAHDRHDMAAAGDMLWRAWTLLESIGIYRFELGMMVQDAFVEHLDVDRAKPLLDDFRKAAATGDVRFEAACLIGRAAIRSRMDTSYPVAEGLKDARQALEIYTLTGTDEGQARAQGTLTWLYWVTGQVDASLESARAVVEMASRLGDGYLASWGYSDIAKAVIGGSTPVEEARTIVKQFLTVAESHEDRAQRTRAVMSLAKLDAMKGDVAALASFDAVQAVFEDFGLLVPLGFGAYDILLPFGELERVERHLRMADETLKHKGAITVRSSILARLANVLYLQGQIDEGTAMAIESKTFTTEDDLDAVIVCGMAEARLLASRGDCSAALASLTNAIAAVSQTEWSVLHADVLLAGSEVLVRCGRIEEARATLVDARARYEAKGHLVGVAAADALLSDEVDRA